MQHSKAYVLYLSILLIQYYGKEEIPQPVTQISWDHNRKTLKLFNHFKSLFLNI